MTANQRVGDFATPMRRLKRADDGGLIPGSSLAITTGIKFRGFQSSGIAAEISDGGGVQAGIILLQPAAVQRLAVLGAKLELEDDRRLIPGAIHDDVIGIEAGSVKRRPHLPKRRV